MRSEPVGHSPVSETSCRQSKDNRRQYLAATQLFTGLRYEPWDSLAPHRLITPDVLCGFFQQKRRPVCGGRIVALSNATLFANAGCFRKIKCKHGNAMCKWQRKLGANMSRSKSTL
jgi:hypothetical protein